MAIEFRKIFEIFEKSEVITEKERLIDNYCKPFLESNSAVPLVAVLPHDTEQISKFIKYIRSLKEINVVLISSKTSPKFLDDIIIRDNSAIIDLSRMKKISFINKRNRVCVVEPGVTWSELVIHLKERGMRPLAPLLPRPGKSALASILDREPHLIPKKQFDISDPLFCMEVVFGNGEIFRTGEAAGPLSIEKNRKAGAALTNPLGPGQTDIFRIIQGSKGTYGCVSWISMQCDLIPEKREVKFLELNTLEPLVEFIYMAVRKRLIDEAFVINDNLFNAIFLPRNSAPKKLVLIYAINGYDFLPEEKISYQLEDSNDILKEMGLSAQNNVISISQKDWEPILDGNSVIHHPKYSDKVIAIDMFYNTTLNRVQNHLLRVQEILKKHNFPSNRFYFYLQPIIQARAANVEFSLLADRPDFKGGKKEVSLEKTKSICREIAQLVSKEGGFFSRSYSLINNIAFSENNKILQESLKKLKRIFDPDGILNKGQLVF